TAPVLLTRGTSLPIETAAEINRLGASTIYILGGPGAVSDVVETALSGYGTTQRLFGSNRYATTAAISQSQFPTASTVYVATGLNFPDALAGAPAAAQDNAPILLVTKDSIPDPTQAELTRLNPTTTVVLGGTAVISNAVAAALPGNVIRLAGSNRYATAAAISAATFNPGVPTIYIATGLNFPDALAGGAAAGYVGGPVLLVGTNDVPAVTAAEIARLTGMPCSAFSPFSFGNGTWVVGTDVPAGRYRMISDGSSCYWERLSGFGGELADIIANDFGFDTQIVDIAPSDAGLHSSSCNIWSNDLSPRRANPAAPLVSDGHYLVGSEMTAGTWANNGPAAGEFCYWERLSGFSGELADIITNDFTDTNSIVAVSITDVGFYADPDCGTWTKIG
ncbi:MAG: cell wall-binding repeat-containing protein, partial [Acidimicrobiia bacterium]|nr:cell wall-binding repeat-containing protein [Acidimicrobiia bacterium]